MGLKLQKVSLTYSNSKKKIKKGTCRYALVDIDLTIDANNEFISLVGHTGSGKSTLVQILNALLIPTKGDLFVDGRLVTKKTRLKPIRKKVGLVFQFPEYQVFEDTVKKDIAFGPKNFKLPSIDERVDKVAKILKIENLLNRNPFLLSGGQMRKVAIAGILASDPDILILDEPTAGLDGQSKVDLLAFLEHLNRDLRKTVILISHDMDVVAEYSKRIIVLDDGKKVFDGTPYELFSDRELLSKHHLTIPQTVSILETINKTLNVKLNPYKFSVQEAVEEIKNNYE